jgi:hypothetical protein
VQGQFLQPINEHREKLTGLSGSAAMYVAMVLRNLQEALDAASVEAS